MTWVEFCRSDYNTDGWYAYNQDEGEADYYVETFYNNTGWNAYEWGWIATEDTMWEEHIERYNNQIIPNHTYYEQFDSDAGIGGGGWG